MTEKPPEQDNQAAPAKHAKTTPDSKDETPSPEQVETMPKTEEEGPTQKPEETETVEVNSLDKSAPDEPVEELPEAKEAEPVEELPEAKEAEPVEEAPFIPQPRTRSPRKRSMRDIGIGKVVVNITVGESGEPLDRAMTILENLTGQKPVVRRAKQTIRSWGIRRNEPIACIVTLRRDRAEDFLKKTFPAIGNRVSPRSFDKQGNFAFGIREHIDIPGQRYDPNLGIVGMDVMATVERPGYRVTRRRRAKSRVSHSHRVKREESIEFIKQSFGVEVGLPNE
jgi:large subunit ribosomal protein L5